MKATKFFTFILAMAGMLSMSQSANAEYNSESATAEQKAVEKFIYQALYNNFYASDSFWGFYDDAMLKNFERLGITSSLDQDDQTIPHAPLLTKEFHDKFYSAFRKARGNHSKYKNEEIIRYLPDPEEPDFIDYMFPSAWSTPKKVNFEITDIEFPEDGSALVTGVWSGKTDRHFKLKKVNGQWKIDDIGLVVISGNTESPETATWTEVGYLKPKIEAFGK